MWYKNVLIETQRIENQTETKIVNIEVIDGKIASIQDDLPILEKSETVIDAQSMLLLPSFKDYHIHLDKGHYGGPWQAPTPIHSIMDRIAEEEQFLTSYLPYTATRAQALIDLITHFGATFLRVQVNVDPVIGLDNLKTIQTILQKNKDKLDYEIVAFPQHGISKTEAKELLTEAAKFPEVTHIGGVDPAIFDEDIEKGLRIIFDIAQKYHKGIDIHLHDAGTLGIYEIERIIKYTEMYDLKGKVAISHALALGDLDSDQLIPLYQAMQNLNIAINTTIPLSTPTPNIMKLSEYGVDVNIINDNINDHWSPFGSGDLLQRANRAAERFNLKTEKQLASTLKYITGGIETLDNLGNYQWPLIGDTADFVFIDAVSSAHAIARIPEKRVVVYKGKQIFGKFY